jgi:hypothetical protein
VWLARYLEPPFNGAPARVTGYEGGKLEITLEHEAKDGKIVADTNFAAAAIKALKPTLYFPMEFVSKKLALNDQVLRVTRKLLTDY